ncbi:MAG: hypothetical protein P4M11_13990 [Candidatus Pacebacteria bacterium]|nr:hypothetical protein [Candidatus Paceibacterota bacterium]
MHCSGPQYKMQGLRVEHLPASQHTARTFAVSIKLEAHSYATSGTLAISCMCSYIVDISSSSDSVAGYWMSSDTTLGTVSALPADNSAPSSEPGLCRCSIMPMYFWGTETATQRSLSSSFCSSSSRFMP